MTRRGTHWAASLEAQYTRCAHHGDWLTPSCAALRLCQRACAFCNVLPAVIAEAYSLQGIIFTAGIMWNFLQKINVPIHVQEASRCVIHVCMSEKQVLFDVRGQWWIIRSRATAIFKFECTAALHLPAPALTCRTTSPCRRCASSRRRYSRRSARWQPSFSCARCTDISIFPISQMSWSSYEHRHALSVWYSN